MVSISVPSSIEFLRRGTTSNVFVGWGTAHKHNLKVDGPCRIYRNRKAQGIRIACQIGNVQFFWLFSFPSGELVVCSPILKRERTERCEIALQERNFILKAVGFAGVEEFGIGPPTETEKARRRSLRSWLFHLVPFLESLHCRRRRRQNPLRWWSVSSFVLFFFLPFVS